MLVIHLLALLMFIPIPSPTLDQHMWFWGNVYGTDPDLLYAVGESETGAVPEPGEPSSKRYGPGVHRDNVVFRGNYSRWQINKRAWFKRLNLTPEYLQDPGNSAKVAAYVLRRWKKKCKRRSKLCLRPEGVHWTCHWNAGWECNDRSIAFAGRVMKHLAERRVHKRHTRGR